MHWTEKFHNVTWPQFIDESLLLSQRIKKSGKKFDLIVAIARGGLTLAQLLSDSLQLPIASFTVESYKDLKQEKLPHITHSLSTSLHNKKILLVDDICDTGKTFVRGLEHLQELGAEKQNITTASLYFKPHAEYKPDFYFGETSAWVIYPYEVRETIAQVAPIWKQAGISNEEIQKRFLSFGFPHQQVASFLNRT